MKTINVRVPELLAAEIEAESHQRRISKSDVVRERLENGKSYKKKTVPLEDIADLIGSVDGLPSDLSAKKKYYLRATGYGRNRNR